MCSLGQWSPEPRQKHPDATFAQITVKPVTTVSHEITGESDSEIRINLCFLC